MTAEPVDPSNFFFLGRNLKFHCLPPDILAFYYAEIIIRQQLGTPDLWKFLNQREFWKNVPPRCSHRG